jgi:hypothetical protein
MQGFVFQARVTIYVSNARAEDVGAFLSTTCSFGGLGLSGLVTQIDNACEDSGGNRQPAEKYSALNIQPAEKHFHSLSQEAMIMIANFLVKDCLDGA